MFRHMTEDERQRVLSVHERIRLLYWVRKDGLRVVSSPASWAVGERPATHGQTTWVRPTLRDTECRMRWFRGQALFDGGDMTYIHHRIELERLMR